MTVLHDITAAHHADRLQQLLSRTKDDYLNLSQVLARIDDRIYRQRVDQAKASALNSVEPALIPPPMGVVAQALSASPPARAAARAREGRRFDMKGLRNSFQALPAWPPVMR